MIIPVEEQIFPFKQRLGEFARIAIRSHLLHRIVGFLEVATVHVFLGHLVRDAVNGEEDVTEIQRGFALGVCVQ